MDLTQQKCVPCEVGGIPLTPAEAASQMKDIPLWKLSADAKKLSRAFSFKDFKESLAFINKIGELAEKEGHHPDFDIHYNKVTLTLWTHEVGGLSINDFIVAAKVDKVS